MSKGQYRVQIVEDDQEVQDVIAQYITSLGHSVVGLSSTGKDALFLTNEIHPDLVLMDIGLRGEINGIQTAKELKSLHNLPIVFVTGSFDDKTIEEAKEAEPMGYLIKPIDLQELKVTIEFAIFKHQLQSEKENLITELTDSFSNILRNYAHSEDSTQNPHKWFR